ncbi:hypothetical protein LUZ60_008020 [Juncus effusus]|nr:hypothetical protein LUZ60_008020 [Juncus effusus]
MCGRARCTVNQEQVARACGFTRRLRGGSSYRTLPIDRYRPSYNASPGAYMPVATVRRGNNRENGDEEGDDSVGPVIQCMKWGLIPSFTKKNEKADHFKMFNARSESVREKASFRRLIPSNRCLVAIEGFYEWKKDGSKKQPYYIHFKDNRPLVLAALYDSWTNSEGEKLYTFTILTTRCSSSLEWLHDRMPVILGSESSIDTWLDYSTQKVESLLVPYEGSDLIWHPVSTEVGKTSFNGPDCIKEIQLKSISNNPISKFFTKKSEKETPKPSMNSIKQESCDDKTDVKSEQFYEAEDFCKCEDLMAPKLEDEREKSPCAGIKREFEETESNLASPPMKKEKVGKKDEGQLSLLSYFAKK